jgi:hypothetical protein
VVEPQEITRRLLFLAALACSSLAHAATELPATASVTAYLAAVQDAAARQDLRGELATAEAGVRAHPADGALTAAWASALLRAGDFAQATQVLADQCAARGAQAADQAALVSAVQRWQAADPPRTAQTSGWQRLVAAWQTDPSGGPRQRCQQAALQALQASQQPGGLPPGHHQEQGGTAAGAVDPTAPPRRSPLQPTPQTWLWVGISAVVFIGGASWLTRKQR